MPSEPSADLTLWGSILALDWASFATTLLAAGLATAFVTVGHEWLRDRRERENRAAWVALQTAVALETFAVDCLRTLARVKAIDTPEEPVPDIPALGRYPEDAEGWRALDRALAERALSFPAEVMVLSALTPTAWELRVDKQRTNLPQTALAAVHIARDLRTRYNFRPHAFLLERARAEFDREQKALG